MKKLFLLLLTICFAISCNNAGPKKQAAPAVDKMQAARYKYGGDMVYSYGYDGFVNMRAQPTTKSAKVGRFNNGPEGAVLLQDLGTWKKIDLNGVVGYVLSKYLVDTATVPYTGRVDVNWVTGVWYINGYGFMISANGYWESGYNNATRCGYYIMQNNEVKLVTVLELDDPYSTKWRYRGAKGLPSDVGETFAINQRAGTLGGGYKTSFLTGNETAEELEGIDWCCVTKAQFKQSGRGVAQQVQPYLKRK